MVVFITVPHAGCFEFPKERHCDRLAEKAGYSLYYLIPDSIIFVGKVFRGDLDLNRDQALNDPFRVNIRQAANKFRPSIVLDTHSFPEKYTNFGDVDVMILDEKPGTIYGRDIARFLRDKTSYRVAYSQGDGNSIMIEMRRMGIPSVLVEFMENLRDNDLAIISEKILEWLVLNGYLD